MTIRIVSDAPVVTKRVICARCGYELEFNDVDTVAHRTDSDGDAIERCGMYLVCPREECKHRNLVKPRY